MKLQKFIFGIVIVCITIAIAYVTGIKAAEHWKNISKNTNEDKAKQSILSQMNNLSLGDTLPDYSFDDLSFQSKKLRPMIEGKTMLIFIQPGCPFCLADIELLNKYIQEDTNASKFIIISAGDPRELIELRNTYELKMPILYDHERGYSSIFGVFTYPFHIVINKDMAVTNIITRKLTEKDIINIIQKL